MGREIRRVPVDFDWPTNEIWSGFLMPDKYDEDPCSDCYRLNYRGERTSGTGSTPAAKWLEAALYLVGMMAEDIRAQQFEGAEHQYTQFGDDRSKLHPYLAALQRINVYEHRRPSADIIDLVTGIIGRTNVSFGVGSDFAWKATEALRAAAGLPDAWGTCPACEGHGSIEKYPGQRAESEAWNREDPPVGDGWQVWETVSEGSPISPVFADRDGLIDWLMSPAYTWGTSTPLTRGQAEAFVESAWAPSGVVIDGKYMPGDAAMEELKS